MKYCANCGKELFDEAVICPGCGTATNTYNNYVRSEKAFPTEKISNSPTEQKSENCASENPTFNSNTNEAPEPLVSDEAPDNSFSDEAPENPVSDESPDEGTYDESPEYLVAGESPDKGTYDVFLENDPTDDTVESTDSDETDSNSSSIQTAKKKVIPKKLRVVAVIATAIVLVVLSALSAVYIYNARHVKGLTFNSVEAMESYANGFYIYDNKILWINDSYYRVCNIKSITFVADEYINEYNNVKKNCNVYNDRELIEYYLKKTDRSELGFGLNNGTLIDIQTNRKLFAVQGDGILFAFDRSNNGKPIERINVAKMTESSPELKSTLETFRSDYEKAVEEAEEKKPKKAYFPTVDEYIGRFKKEYTSDFTRTNYYSDGYVLLKWKIKFNYSVTFSYQIMLYVNTKDEITSCNVSIVDSQFLNKFTTLLNSDAQSNAFTYLTFPVYLLCCMHNGVENDMEGFTENVARKMGEVYPNGGTSEGIYNGCELSVSLTDWVLSCSLDWGNAHEKSKN